MDSLGLDIIKIFEYLMPGFLTAWIYYGFTSFQIPSQFERVIQAFIFTLLIQPIVYTIKFCSLWIGDNLFLLGYWSESSDIAASVIAAFILGITVCFFTNNDKFHRLMRSLKITKESSYPSEWYGAFDTSVTYIVLHLPNNRRIYGWPREWPSNKNNGHFVLENSSWLDKDNRVIAMSGVAKVLVPSNEIQLVEFMEMNNV